MLFIPEFTFKQLKKELEAMGFTVRQDASGHYRVYWQDNLVSWFAMTHGANTKRGMIKMPYYRNVMKKCKLFLEQLNETQKGDHHETK